jgi:recombination protein RecA
MASSDSARRARQVLQTPPAVEASPQPEDFLSTGLTLVNLACYGHAYGGVAKGHIYRVWGRSSSGKTFLCRQILAEAARSQYFDDYDLVYDDVEYGALMDTEKFFGKRLVSRLVAPARFKESHLPAYSRTLAEFYDRLARRLEAGRPCVWVLDSIDALKPDNLTKMGDGKAKANNQGLRSVLDLLKATKSILILVNQAHADLGSVFKGDTTSGGRALEFYPTLDLRLRVVGGVRRTFKGNEFKVGSLIAASVVKNRISGNNWTVYFPFDPKYGLDDIGANLDFLIKYGRWDRTKGVITATDFALKGDRWEVIREIERQELEQELRVLTAKTWHDIDAALTVERKPAYE